MLFKQLAKIFFKLRWFYVAIISLLLPIICLLFIFILLQFDFFRTPLLTFSQNILQQEGIYFKINELKGIIPINFKISQFILYDKNGIWFEIKGITCNWNIISLLHGRIQINEINVSELNLIRLPLQHSINNSKKSSQFLDLKIPWWLPSINIDNLAIQDINLDSVFLGEPLHLSLIGKIIPVDVNKAQLFAQLQRIDQNTADIILISSFDTDQNFNTKLIANESGGLIKRLLKLPLTGPINFQFTGDGKINNLPGELKLNLPGIIELNTLLTIKIDKNQHLNIFGTVNPALELFNNYKFINLLGSSIPFILDIKFINQIPILHQLLIDTSLGKLEVRGGNLLDLDFEIIFLLKNKKFNELPPIIATLIEQPLKLTAKTNLDNNNLINLKNLTISGKYLNFNSTGYFSLKDNQLLLQSNLKLSQLELFKKYLGIPIDGEISAKINLAGLLNYLNLELTINSKNLTYSNYNLKIFNTKLKINQQIEEAKGNLEINLGINSQMLNFSSQLEIIKSKLNFTELLITAPETKLNGNLNLNLANFLINGKLFGRINELNDWRLLIGMNQFKGSIDFNSEFIASAPNSQKLVFNVKGNNIVNDFIKISEFKINLNLADIYNYSINNLQLTAVDISQNKYNISSFIANAHGSSNFLEIIANLNAELPYKTTIKLNCQLEKKQHLYYITLKELIGNWRELPFQLKIPVNLIVKQNEFIIEQLKLNLAGANLNATGKFNYREIDATVLLDSFPLKLLTYLNIPELDGIANAQLIINGTKIKPQIKFNTEIKNLTSIINDKRLPKLQVNGNAELTSEQIIINCNINNLNDKKLQGHLTIPIKFSLYPINFYINEQLPLAGNINIIADLKHLFEFLGETNQKLSGIIDGVINIDGNITQPNLFGNIKINKGYYENGITGTLLKNINLDLQLTGKNFALIAVNANDVGNGDISAKGKLELNYKNGLNFDSKININKAKLINIDNASIILGGNLTIIGNQQRANIQGDLDLIKADIQLPEQIASEIPKLVVKEINQRHNKNKIKFNDINQESIYPLDLDVNLAIPSRTFVRGRGLDSEWRGDLKIKGSALKPQIIGQLRVQRGIFDFLDRRFKIQDGILEFLGDYPPIPNIEINAVVNNRDNSTFVLINGLANKPKLTLESQPQLPQDEILARLLFDREVKNISALQALKLALALQTLTSGKRGFDLFNRTRNSLGLDTLDMENNANENKAIKAGKYLRDNVYLEVESGLESDTSKIRVEREISRQLSIESSVDQNSNSSFGINWKVDY